MAPDGSGRPRRERAALRRRRRRRREGAGWRGRREAGEAPAAGRARGRLRGAGAGARAGSCGGYDDPAAGPRIASPPPPPRGGPGSRLRTTHTGGESGRARMDGVRAPRGGRPEVAPSGPRAAGGRAACTGSLSGQAPRGPGSHVPLPDRERRDATVCPGNSPCLLPLPSRACCCPQVTGARLASPHPWVLRPYPWLR